MMKPFRTATIKLTAWYLGVLMAVSLAFSVVIFHITAHELDRPVPQSGALGLSVIDERIDDFRERRAAESKRIVVGDLIILNIVTLTLGAAASYVFARRTLQPIESAMEAQARFTSDASHELRTPLAVMRTENEIALREKKPSIAALKNVVSSNLEEVARLQQLTDRLLALSSEQEVPLEPFAAKDAIEEAISRHYTAAEQKSISIKATLAKQLPSINANVESVSDILSILLENAIKYSPEKSTITLSVVAHGSSVEISVSDNGTGIAEEDMQYIFDRFYRADQSRSKQNIEGHGLGLALAKRLAEQNHASLSVSNKKPHGAIFTIRLPKA